MFYHRCSLIKQINTTTSEQDATTDNLLTNAASSLTTFNKVDDDVEL